MEDSKIFNRDGDIISNLDKGRAYFGDLSKNSNDIHLMPKGDKLAKKIAQLSQGLQNGHTNSEKNSLISECIKEIDEFRTCLFNYQQRNKNALYDKNRSVLDEFHTAIVMYGFRQNLN